MFEKFIQQIDSKGKLTMEELAYLREHSKIRFCKKGDEILRAGKIAKNIYFVLDGCVRLFYNVDGKDKTAFFYKEGDFIWANKSLRHNIPTQKNYEAIEDTILVQIDKQIAFDFIESSRNFDSITRNYKDQELIAYQHLIAHFITLSPEGRFLHLIETNKLLIQRVPQHFIASYLGVSSETIVSE